MDKGYILLSRSLLDSDVFASQKLLKIWIWCLCKANFKDRAVTHTRGKSEQIIRLKRGQFIFGRFKAEEELFIDGSTIYKSIKKLEQMSMIKIQSNKSFSIITICKYNTYQDNKQYKVATGEHEGSMTVPTEYPQSNTTNTLKKDNTLPNDILLEKETKELFNIWIDYRKEIKKTIKSKKTLIALANKIQEKGINESEKVINYSIENGYQGLFWDKKQNNKEKNVASKTAVTNFRNLVFNTQNDE